MLEEHIEGLLVQNYSKTLPSTGDVASWTSSAGRTARIQHPMEVTRPISKATNAISITIGRRTGSRSRSARNIAAVAGVPVVPLAVRNNRILYNPASDLDMPRLEKRIPRTISRSRDRAHHAGAGHSFGGGLARPRDPGNVLLDGHPAQRTDAPKLYDVDRQRATLTIREGKGKKDRMIPIGERALLWVEKYLREARSLLAVEPDDATVFLTQYGESFSPDSLSSLTRDYIAERISGNPVPAHVPAHHGDTHARRRRKSSLHPADARAHEPEQHGNLHTRGDPQAATNPRVTHPGATLERKVSAIPSDIDPEEAERKAELLAALDAEGDEEETGRTSV